MSQIIVPAIPPPSFNYKKHTTVLKLMKEKVPLAFLSIHSLISNILYSPKFINDTMNTVSFYDNKSSQYIYHPEEDIDSLRSVFWVYYPILCSLCFAWEFFHSFHTYKIRHTQYQAFTRNIYAVLSSFISVLTFIFVSYYINNGRPFSRIFDYNYMIATVLFYLWGGILWIYTHVEHIVHTKKLRNFHSQIVPATA